MNDQPNGREPFPPANGEQNAGGAPNEQRKPAVVSLRFFIGTACFILAFSVVFSYFFAYSTLQRRYANDLAIKNQQLQTMQTLLGGDSAPIGLLMAIMDANSLYKDSLSEEEMIDAVLREYSRQTGDKYVAYYTPEEYAYAGMNDRYQGIGIETRSAVLTVDGVEYNGYLVEDYQSGSPAELGGVRRNDFIYAVKTQNGFETVNSLGIEHSIQHLRGSIGDTVAFRVYRKQSDGSYQSFEFSLVCAEIVTTSVSYTLCRGAQNTAVVSITSFDKKTPLQFKTIMNSLLESGVEHFVLDLRNNPGGDLLSVLAMVSFFLSNGDLILTSQKADGSNVTEHRVEKSELEGEYASCNVSDDEIGMYKDLDTVILCNEKTASAAEVFTAALMDHDIAPVVGTQTFGKGIIQSVYNLSSFGNFKGYVKLTTYEYLPPSGESYHLIGVEPSERVELSEQAKQYHYKEIPEDIDNQLQAALRYFNQ